MNILANATGPLRERLTSALTPAIVRAKLVALAAALELRPSLRHHLRDVHASGARVAFDATIEFVTADGRDGAHVIFGDGHMRVRGGTAKRADTRLTFRDRAHMRRFFSGEDTFGMLLDGGMQLDGNLSYLFKFAHMSTDVTRGGRSVAARPAAGTGGWPSDWRELVGPPTGRPSRERPVDEVLHLADPALSAVSLDDLPRVKRLLWAARTTRPAMCSERARLLTEFVVRHRAGPDAGDEPVLRQAKALHAILTRRRATIHDDDLIAGTTTSKRIGIIVFPELGGIGMWPELLTMAGRELNPYDISDEDIAILDREVFPFWMDDNVRDWTKRHTADPLPFELDERFVLYFLWKTQAASHTVIDFPRALGRGLLDIHGEAHERELRAKTPAERAFYQALQLTLSGVMAHANRLADEAERQLRVEQRTGAEGDARRETLGEMARICRKVPAHPPETLAEAIQAIWILFLCQHQENMGAGLVVGRLDLWLEPYWRRELLGVTDPAEVERRTLRALELVSALMLKLTDHLPMVPDLGNRLFGGSSENQVITLGGLTSDGRTAVSDMTYLFLKATEMLRLRDPNVNARFAPGVNSDEYLRRICEVNVLTHATPSLHNDAAIVPALQRQGMSLEHARDWTATGCVEPTSCGRHFGHTNCMLVNVVAPLEMALRDGGHPNLGEHIGPRTGSAASFTSYDDFFAAYQVQLGWVMDRAFQANNELGRAHQTLKPTPLLSALFDGPMEKGRDVTQGGAIYNTSGIAMIGLTDVVDSLCAIHTLVFETREFTLLALCEALRADFVGHERLHARLLAKVPKFGQEHPLPRRIAREVQHFIFEHAQAAPHYRGGRYLPGYWSMSNHVAFGLLSGALPSGRRRGKPFTPGLTPSPLGRSSLTEQLHAVAELDATEMPNNIAFNVKVVPGEGDTHERIVDWMAALTGAYFELGGCSCSSTSRAPRRCARRWLAPTSSAICSCASPATTPTSSSSTATSSSSSSSAQSTVWGHERAALPRRRREARLARRRPRDSLRGLLQGLSAALRLVPEPGDDAAPRRGPAPAWLLCRVSLVRRCVPDGARPTGDRGRARRSRVSPLSRLRRRMSVSVAARGRSRCADRRARRAPAARRAVLPTLGRRRDALGRRAGALPGALGARRA